jgi:translation initiation factor 3 subunit G
MDMGVDPTVTLQSKDDVSIEDPNAIAEDENPEDMIAQLEDRKSIVVCRNCGKVGDHWTLKCPFKDGNAPSPEEAAASAASTGGKYVPPSMRPGAKQTIVSTEEYDILTTTKLRVSNISEDASEQDVRE